jgi:16S rRNA (uracil1498-N3)-methyltransferase
MKIHQLQRIVITTDQKQENNIIFTPEQNHYIYRVLRLKKGDKIIVMDGKEKAWLVNLEQELNPIIEPFNQQTELPINVTLICALPKGNNFDEIVRYCTELGVNTIIPVISERTLLKPSENKIQRWRKIALEATEQSERQLVPHISNPLPFLNVLPQITLSKEKNTLGYICVARGENPSLLSCLQKQDTSNIIIMTGTEGGWSDREIKTAIELKFQPVSLGKRILRAVTAPIMALSIIACYSETAQT